MFQIEIWGQGDNTVSIFSLTMADLCSVLSVQYDPASKRRFLSTYTGEIPEHHQVWLRNKQKNIATAHHTVFVEYYF